MYVCVHCVIVNMCVSFCMCIKCSSCLRFDDNHVFEFSVTISVILQCQRWAEMSHLLDISLILEGRVTRLCLGTTAGTGVYCRQVATY